MVLVCPFWSLACLTCFVYEGRKEVTLVCNDMGALPLKMLKTAVLCSILHSVVLISTIFFTF